MSCWMAPTVPLIPAQTTTRAKIAVRAEPGPPNLRLLLAQVSRPTEYHHAVPTTKKNANALNWSVIHHINRKHGGSIPIIRNQASCRRISREPARAQTRRWIAGSIAVGHRGTYPLICMEAMLQMIAERESESNRTVRARCRTTNPWRSEDRATKPLLLCFALPHPTL